MVVDSHGDLKQLEDVAFLNEEAPPPSVANYRGMVIRGGAHGEAIAKQVAELFGSCVRLWPMRGGGEWQVAICNKNSVTHGEAQMARCDKDATHIVISGS